MSFPAICSLADFKLRTLMRAADVDGLENQFPGFIAAQINIYTSKIYSRLAKKPYAVPFTNVPDIVIGWCVAMVTPIAYLKRGVDPNGSQFTTIKEMADLAEKELTEAANEETGLFDLPMIENAQPATSAGLLTTTLADSQSDPYEWTDVQAQQSAFRGFPFVPSPK